MDTHRSLTTGLAARLLAGAVLTLTAGAGLVVVAAPAGADVPGASPTSGAVTTDAAGISSAGLPARAATPACGKKASATKVAGCGKRGPRR